MKITPETVRNKYKCSKCNKNFGTYMDEYAKHEKVCQAKPLWIVRMHIPDECSIDRYFSTEDLAIKYMDKHKYRYLLSLIPSCMDTELDDAFKNED